MSEEFRGVGDIRSRAPIGAVLEVLRRAPDGNGKWLFVRPFTKTPDGAEYAFQIMQSVTTTTVARGNMTAPAREPHPKFEMFNVCEPVRARTIKGRILNWAESEAYKYFLGAFQSPGKSIESPKAGWWCKGDGCRATRWIDGKFTSIPCPGEMCEYQQEKFGIKGDQAHCKPNLTLIAQFNWPDMPDGKPHPLPKCIFQWDSKSWNAISGLNGLFGMIHETAEKLGYPRGKFPVFNLTFEMTVKERIRKNGRRHPEVSFSFDGDLMDWMMKVHGMAQNAPVSLPAPQTLKALPAGEFTSEDMERASEAALNPNYRPANERLKDANGKA